VEVSIRDGSTVFIEDEESAMNSPGVEAVTPRHGAEIVQ
jgi:hypothetical protein